MNPYLNRLAAAGRQDHGKLSEKRVTKTLPGARLQPNSGAMESAKSDARGREFRYEMKSTDGQTLSLHKAMFDKIQHEANQSGEYPALAMSFVQTGSGKAQPGASDWVAVPKWVFTEMLERLGGK